ncbi:MAG: DUF86 domain-containing protein [Nitrospirae bacterium]|nr:DUF86 domain-containing protein [Nitrospirota bacterium]
MMLDVILNKKESIERCIQQIRLYYAMPSELPFEKDHLKQDAIAANLQRAAEQAIDLANHVIRKGKLGMPKDSKESFEILARVKVIPEELANKLKGMVGFRNIMVHQYQEMDIKIMVDVIEHHLDDLVVLTNHVMEFGRGHSS